MFKYCWISGVNKAPRENLCFKKQILPLQNSWQVKCYDRQELWYKL